MRLGVNLLLLLGLALCACVWADTEIRNFRVPDEHPALATPPHAALHLQPRTTTTLKLNSSHPELWAHVPLPDGAWTARISWPAFMPTRFGLVVYSWSAEVNSGSTDESGWKSSNGALLHITAEALSPRLRHPLLFQLGLASDPATVRPDDEFDTTFHLLVEPLYLGVLPATAVSAIRAAVVMVALAVCAAPFIWRKISPEARTQAAVDKSE